MPDVALPSNGAAARLSGKMQWMSEEDPGRKATEIGLDLTPDQLEQFADATALARRLADLVSRDLPLTEEPALTLRLRRRMQR